jgi:hypothetical protein
VSRAVELCRLTQPRSEHATPSKLLLSFSESTHHYNSIWIRTTRIPFIIKRWKNLDSARFEKSVRSVRIWTRTTWKSEMTRDQMTQNLSRSEPKWPETRDDPRLNNSKFDPTRATYMYLITLKLYCINIKFLFINWICTWLPVYFEGS